MDHGVEVPGRAQSIVCVAARVAKRGKKKSRRRRSRRRARRRRSWRRARRFQNGQPSPCSLSPCADAFSLLSAALLADAALLLLPPCSPRRAAPCSPRRACPRSPASLRRAPRSRAHRAPQPRTAQPAPRPRAPPASVGGRPRKGSGASAVWAARAAVRCGRRRPGSRSPPEVFLKFSVCSCLFLSFRLVISFISVII